MPRVMVTADWHIGASPDFGAPGQRVSDQARMAREIASLVTSEQVDVVIEAGDVFHRRRPTPVEYLAWREFADWVTVPILSVTGNHDLASLDMPDAQQPVVGATHRHYRRPAVVRFPEFEVAMLPWTIPSAAVTDWVGSYEGAVSSVGESLVEIAAALRARCGPAAMLVLHWSLSGAVTPSGVSTAEFREPVIPVSELVGQGWSAVCAGHIHRRQILSESPLVFYPGSPWAVDWGEIREPHGVTVFDVSELGAVTGVRHIDIEDRPFVAIDEIEWDDDAPILPAVQDAVVRVRVEIPAESNGHPLDGLGADGLRRLIYEAGANRVYQVQITDLRRRRERARVPELTETTTPLDALSLWLERQPDLTAMHRAELTALATELVQEVGA